MRKIKAVGVWLGVNLGVLLVLAPGVVNAQTTAAEQRDAAAAAYDRGTKAYVAGDYARSARFYETAFRLAPSANALIQAVRALQRANNEQRAGTVALALQEEYGVKQMASHTREALSHAQGKYFRVDVVCEKCELEIDGKKEIFASVFLDPGTDHQIVAKFDSGEASRTVSGAAGAQQVVPLIEPNGRGAGASSSSGEAKAEDEDGEQSDEAEEGTSATSTSEESSGLAPTFFWVGVGLTAVLAGVTVWSALDTKSAADEYEKNPTQQAFDDGQSLELRTNILIGAASVVALATIGIGALFTDWDGGNDSESESSDGAQLNASAVWLPGGAMATVQGRF